MFVFALFMSLWLTYPLLIFTDLDLFHIPMILWIPVAVVFLVVFVIIAIKSRGELTHTPENYQKILAKGGERGEYHTAEDLALAVLALHNDHYHYLSKEDMQLIS